MHIQIPPDLQKKQSINDKALFKSRLQGMELCAGDGLNLSWASNEIFPPVFRLVFPRRCTFGLWNSIHGNHGNGAKVQYTRADKVSVREASNHRIYLETPQSHR